mmetsp:Transcript_5966/g.6946  ORF Transcript_5966/g.6946 Transcript_5966/m.6946 type:complete len:80 (-) Transcript_5966:86-325(-)
MRNFVSKINSSNPQPENRNEDYEDIFDYDEMEDSSVQEFKSRLKDEVSSITSDLISKNSEVSDDPYKLPAIKPSDRRKS